MNDIDFYTSKNNTLPAKRMSVDYALRLIQEGRYKDMIAHAQKNGLNCQNQLFSTFLIQGIRGQG